MHDKKICCLAVDDEWPALEVLKKYISAVPHLQLAGTYTDPIGALPLLQNHAVDLLFLHIQMPRILGTDFLRTLKNPPKIIFTTAYRKFAVEGFELDAVDYLLKPVSFERFLKAVNKVMDALNLAATHMTDKEVQQKIPYTYLSLRSEHKMIKVALNEILYIESLKDYIKVVTPTKSILTKQPISSIEELLPKELFTRIHRSYIVALHKVESYTSERVWIAKQELPISRMYRHEVEKVLPKM